MFVNQCLYHSSRSESISSHEFNLKVNNRKPNFVVIVTDAFDGRIVANKTYQRIVNLENLSKLQGLEFLDYLHLKRTTFK